MDLERPDLSEVPAVVVAYIEALEKRLRLAPGRRSSAAASADAESESEPPTTVQVITASATGLAKRTPRHMYGRQRRGGMGVFDIQLPADDPPALIAVSEAEDALLLITNHGRIFKRLPRQIAASDEVRARGAPIGSGLPYRPGERLVSIMPEPASGYVVLVSERGWLRRIHAGYLGRSMIDGTSFHDLKEGGYLVSAAPAPGGGDLLVATRNGMGIRFREAQVPARGCLGIRLAPDDVAVGVAATAEMGGVFLLTADGKGTVRLMAGFRANKSPGAGGKVLIKSDAVVGVVPVGAGDDLFLLSRQSKIIRFAADEVPAKSGVVQGVNCFSLRADDAVAVCRVALTAPA